MRFSLTTLPSSEPFPSPLSSDLPGASFPFFPAPRVYRTATNLMTRTSVFSHAIPELGPVPGEGSQANIPSSTFFLPRSRAITKTRKTGLQSIYAVSRVLSPFFPDFFLLPPSILFFPQKLSLSYLVLISRVLHKSHALSVAPVASLCLRRSLITSLRFVFFFSSHSTGWPRGVDVRTKGTRSPST